MNTLEGASKIDFYNSRFIASLSEINQELDKETFRILCSGDFASKGFEQILSGMDEVDSIRERLNSEHYAVTLDKLSARERNTFQAFLGKKKRSMSYVKLDHVKYYGENAEKEAYAYQAAVCSENSARRQ